MPTAQRILVVMPNWVGDAVMAIPTLRALRELRPDAHIACLMRRYVKPILTGVPWVNKLITYRTGKTTAKAGKGRFLDLSGRLRSGKFDTALLLPNSFQSALICKLARIKRVIGYDRDGRGFLLTDRLLPPKDRGKYIPSPIVKYYLGLVQYMGSHERDVRLELFVTDSERQRAAEVLAHAGLDRQTERPGASGKAPLILINPGAQYGAAKLWLPEHFAVLADRFHDELGATILISGSPKERPMLDEVLSHMKHRPINLSSHGLTLGALKDIVRRCDLVVTNDTGPRHIAAAFEVPVVTIFGPTHPEWTEIYFAKERKVAVKVFCGPCQKKKCPLDHRCMTRVSPGMVYNTALDLLSFSASAAPQR